MPLVHKVAYSPANLVPSLSFGPSVGPFQPGLGSDIHHPRQMGAEKSFGGSQLLTLAGLLAQALRCPLPSEPMDLMRGPLVPGYWWPRRTPQLYTARGQCQRTRSALSGDFPLAEAALRPSPLTLFQGLPLHAEKILRVIQDSRLDCLHGSEAWHSGQLD
eukprot:scaffold81094_cov40-Prasinocladus_malaysianus.AAC.2